MTELSREEILNIKDLCNKLLHSPDFATICDMVLAYLDQPRQVIPENCVVVPNKSTSTMQNAAVDVDSFKLGDISPLGFRISPQQLFDKCYEACFPPPHQQPHSPMQR